MMVNADWAHSSIPSERREFVRAQYENLWAGVKAKAATLLEIGERDLSRIHLFMRRNFGPDFENEILKEKYAGHEKQKSKSGFIYDRQIIDVNDADTRVVTLMTDAVKMRAAIDAFGPNIKRVIELGSGWGKNLFNLFKFGTPLATEFIALELTETGREITRALAAHCAPTMRISAKEFDYYKPDFSFLSDNKPTAIFTHHSIEQMPEISGQLLDSILAIPGFSCAVHMEPCGFQIPTNNWLENGNLKLMRGIDTRNRNFAAARNQNTNLYPLLRQYEREGKISIRSVQKYFTSHLIENATTLIVWGPPTATTGNGHEAERRDDLLPDGYKRGKKSPPYAKRLWGAAKRRLIA